MQQVNIQYYYSPCGEIILASVDDELCLCDWNEMPCAERNKLRLLRYMKAEFKIETSPILELAKKQLNEYFTGNRKIFDIPLHLVGTDFQKKVWNALLDIPYGETRSYKEIAQNIGRPNSVRAVAGAIGANASAFSFPAIVLSEAIIPLQALPEDWSQKEYYWRLNQKECNIKC